MGSGGLTLISLRPYIVEPGRPLVRECHYL